MAGNDFNIAKIIQAIPNILSQAKNKYVDDNSIIQVAKSQGIDLNKVLNVISQYENNLIVIGIAQKCCSECEEERNELRKSIKNLAIEYKIMNKE